MSTAAGTDRRTLLRTGVAGLAALAAGAVLTPRPRPTVTASSRCRR